MTLSPQARRGGLRRHGGLQLASEVGGEALDETRDVEAGEVGGAGEAGGDLHR